MLDNIKKIIIEDLKKNNIKIKIEDIFSDNWKDFCENPYQKECVFAIRKFYDFINNENCIKFIEKSYEIFTKNNEFINNIDINKYINNKDKEILLSIFILKGFLKESLIFNDYHAEFKISDKFIDDSAKILNQYNLYNFSISIDNRTIRSFIFKIICYLINEKIVEEKSLNQIMGKDGFKIIKLWKIELGEIKLNPENYYNFCFFEYSSLIINEIRYIKGSHFSTIKELCIKNFYSNERFIIKDENYLKRTLSTKLFIDKKSMNMVKSLILAEGDSTESLLNDYNIIKIKIKNVSNTWDIDTKNKLSDLQKNYSKILEKIILLYFLDIDFKEGDYIYFTIYFDFRGRKYYHSLIGPTYCKYARFLYHYGIYDVEDFKETLTIQRISFFEYKISKFCENNGITYKKKFLEPIFWILISIGKFFIKGKVYVQDIEFIDKAIIFLKKDISEYSFKLIDKIEIMYYKLVLYSLNENVIYKRILVKDGTSSVNQISMFVLKPKNEDSLKYVNLGFNQNEWVDTYLFQKEKFKEEFSLKNKKEIENFDIIFSRKNIKVTLMTIPYSAGVKICYSNFVKKIKESNPEIEINDEIKKNFYSFYFFAKNKIETKFFYKTSMKKFQETKIKEYEKKRKYILETETGFADIGYKKLKKLSMDINISLNNGSKKRITKLIKVVTKSIDMKQTTISSGANTIHFFDGDQLRSLENSLNFSYITIHDAYLVDFNSCSNLIINLNDISEKKVNSCSDINYRIFSIFIVL